METVSRNALLNGQNNQQNGFLQVAGAPVTPITGTMNPPTLRHIPPSPETNLNTNPKTNRDERPEDSYMFLGTAAPQALQGRRGSRDTADSHVSAESGPAHSDSDYGPPVVHDRMASEGNSTRRSTSRHRPSESKSGGMSVSGFFRRKRDRTASTSQAEVDVPERQAFSPPESMSQSADGYTLREGTDSSFDNSDRVSREEGGRASATLGRAGTSLRRKASVTQSFNKTKQGIDRLALGIEHAFSRQHRSHPDKDVSDCETGYNSNDSRTPAVEADNAFDNQGVLALRRRPSVDQGSSAIPRAPPYAALSPASKDIARRNSTLLLQEMSKSGGVASKSEKLVVKVPASGDPAGNLVSPNVSPTRLQSATVTSAHSAPAMAEQSRSLQSGVPSSQTFSNMFTGPRKLSYGASDIQSSEDGHVRSMSAIPRTSQTAGPDVQVPTDSNTQRQQGPSFLPSSDNETRSSKGYKHSRNRTLAILPSVIPLEVVPPERKSSRTVKEQVDGSMTLGRSRSRTLTVPAQGRNDSASDRATSDGETDARRHAPRHRARASENLRTDSELALGQVTETSSSARRRFGSTSEALNGSTVEQSGSEDPYSETPEKPARGVRRLPVPSQRDKENASAGEAKAERTAHSREKSNAEAVRKKRSSEGKSSRATKDRDREGRSLKKDTKRERTFTIPASDVAITSRTSEH